MYVAFFLLRRVVALSRKKSKLTYLSTFALDEGKSFKTSALISFCILMIKVHMKRLLETPF